MSNHESYPITQEYVSLLMAFNAQAGGDITLNMTGNHIPDLLSDDLGMTLIEYAVAGLIVALAVVLVFSQLTMADIYEWLIGLFLPLCP
jgi:Flp pilus assembly pilin Flp